MNFPLGKRGIKGDFNKEYFNLYWFNFPWLVVSCHAGLDPASRRRPRGGGEPVRFELDSASSTE
jgi:hypothetical protein